MVRRHRIVLLAALVAVVGLVAAYFALGPTTPESPTADEEYPEGAGPDHINFSALAANGETVSRTPRDHWESYAVLYTAPPERRLVEGDYYINSTTGEIIADRWHGATEYIAGDTYAFVQPAERIPDQRRRAEFESDDAFVYDDATDAYYRYDPNYGSVAPTNLGRHTNILDAYTWEAVDRTTHHGVPVITYRATGTRNDSRAPPINNGTLRLGANDGVVYAFDITVERDGRTDRYAYDVRPAPFPDHDWVDTAKAVVAENATADGTAQRLHRR